MLPLPPPPDTAIIFEMTKPIDKIWDGFDCYYEEIVAMVTQLEQAIEKADEFDESQMRTLKKVAVQLAQIGSLNASAEEINLLNRDIVQLFIDEEEGTFDLEGFLLAINNPFVTWTMPFPNFDEPQAVPCKSIWKRIGRGIKKGAHEIKKGVKKAVDFVCEHKKEVLIGVAVVVGVGVATYAIAETVTAAAAGAAALANAESEKHGEKARDPPPSVQQDIAIEAPAPLPTPINELPLAQMEILKDPEWEAAFQQDPSIVVQLDPSIYQKLKEEVKEIGGSIAHNLWDGAGELAAIPFQLGKEITDLEAKLPFPPPHVETDHLKTWKEYVVPKGHEKIDEWFGVDQAFRYREEYKRARNERFPVAYLPPPGLGIFKKAEEISQIGESAALAGRIFIAEDFALGNRALNPIAKAGALENRIGGVMEKALTREMPGIQIRPNGIWEIEGRNIKRFDVNKVIGDEDKIEHLFNREHQLNKIANSAHVMLDKITQAVIKADQEGKIPLNQAFKICIPIEQYEVEVRGIVLDGELRYGTFFIPK